MRNLWQHLHTLLSTFRNEAPLHLFLKQYYKQHPKLGSRDRRGLSDAVYAWYRCAKALNKPGITEEDCALAALFLCGLQPKAFAAAWPEARDLSQHPTIASRREQLQAEGYEVDLERLFPGELALSQGVGREEWLEAMLGQPRLFLRIRQDAKSITPRLKAAAIPHEWLTPTCLALPNGTAIDQLLEPDAYVVQDASSQATGAFFGPSANERWWDCCSGAGGKSLLLNDLEPGVRLLASDVRERILVNLRHRFWQYRLHAPETMVLDAADDAAVAKALGNRLFDGIICDVPCTGSGTWARTPESLYFFDPVVAPAYAARGARILRHAARYLKPGGRLVFITCSVFRAENEAVVEQVADAEGLAIGDMQLINGIGRQADCLFVAVLSRK